MNQIRSRRLADVLRALAWTLGILAASSCRALSEHGDSQPSPSAVAYLSPDGLHSNPAFSQVVWVAGPARTVFVGGQNAVDPDGNIVGKGDAGAQGEQIAINLIIALEAAGAEVEHVVKWTIYAVEGTSLGPAMGGFRRVLGILPNPPAISVVFVSGLAHPEFLLEVEAIAVVPASVLQPAPTNARAETRHE